MDERLRASFGVVARDFRRRPWAHKAYVIVLLAGPVGVVLIGSGAISRVHDLVVVGLVLAVVALIDATIFLPLLTRRRKGSEPN